MGVLLLMLLIPWLKGCFHPKPKNITFIDLAAMPPPPQETEPEPEPIPEPKPAPKPKPIPKPAITNTPPKKVETNAPPKKVEPKPEKKKVEPKKAESKPKTLEERLREVRKGGKPVAKPTAKASPQLDFSGIKSALSSAAAGSSAGSGSGSTGGMYSPFAGYYDSVKRQIYSVWQQPAGAPIGLSATAVIRVERDGTVSRKSITSRSGNTSFDQSVQSALDVTTRIPAPPADLPSRDIEIEFVLAD